MPQRLIQLNLKQISSQFKEDFSLSNANPRKFYSSEWDPEPRSSISLVYLSYRGMFMAFLLGAIIFSTSCQPYLFHIFLTNWSFGSQTVYGVLTFIEVLVRWWKRQRESLELKTSSHLGNCHRNSIALVLEGDGNHKTKNKISETASDVKLQVDGVTANTNILKETPNLLEKAVWIFFNVVQVLPYCVVLGYWLVVYKFDPRQPLCEKFKSHYLVHGSTAVLAILDAFIVAIPARRSHFIIPTALVLLYVLFTFIWELAGGPYRIMEKPYIYSVMNWRSERNKAMAFSVLAVLFVPIAHFVFCFGLFKLRVWIVGWSLRKIKRCKETVRDGAEV